MPVRRQNCSTVLLPPVPFPGTRAGAAGFSLLELIFVLGLVAVMTGITIPMVQTVAAQYRLQTSSTTMASKVAQARSEALKRNRPAWLRLTAASRSAQVQTTDAAGNTINVGGIEVLPPAVRFGGFAGATLDVSFDSMGRVVTPPRVFRVESMRLGTQRTLTVVVTGRITIS